MKRQIIAIDIDDVIADSTEVTRLVVNKNLGIDLQAEHYRVPGDFNNYYEDVWRAHGLSDRINYNDHSAQMIVDQSHVTILPGAQFAISELTKKFDIVLITARDPRWQAATKAWVDNNFNGVFKGLYFAGNNDIKDVKSKGEQAVELGAAWLIDDNAGNCQTALDSGIEAILFGNYGWHHDAPDHITRCKDWPAVLEYFS
jgi:5'(3')-deoxyribonucleotidase